MSNKMMAMKYLVLALLLLASCSTYERTEYVGHLDHPPKAAVILGARTSLSSSQIDAFHHEMLVALQQCGIRAEIFMPDVLTLDPSQERDRLSELRRAINADLIITYRETSVALGVHYFVGAALDAQNATVWRSRFAMQERQLLAPAGGWGAGGKIISHLASDGLLRNCKV